MKKLSQRIVDISGLESDNTELKAGQTDIKGQNNQIQADLTETKADSERSRANSEYIVDLGTPTTNSAPGSIAHITSVTGEKLMSYERFYESAVAPNGELHVMDKICCGGGPFQIDAGNDDFGAWVQVVGSDDTPGIVLSNKFFQLSELQIEDAERQSTYIVQVFFGNTPDTSISNDYSEKLYTPQSILIDSGAITINSKRQQVGTKVWIRCMCRGANTGTLDFSIGLNEFSG